MRISTNGTFFERFSNQAQVGKTNYKIFSVGSQANKKNGVENVEQNVNTAAILKDDIANAEHIQAIADQSLSLTLNTLEEMKNLADLASDKSITEEERVELHKRMSELRFQLHENTSSLGLNLAGKTYEDIAPMKFTSVGFINATNFSTESLLKLAEETSLTGYLHQNAEIYTWQRDGSDFNITSFTRAGEDEVAFKKQKVIDNIYDRQVSLIKPDEADKIVKLIEKRIEKINKTREEFSDFKALKMEEKLALIEPSTNANGDETYSSAMGDTVSISSKREAAKLKEAKGKDAETKGEYVKIGDESSGKFVSRKLWEKQLSTKFSFLGDIKSHETDRFGIGKGVLSEGDIYDFRLKKADNELGKMMKKLDDFLKDEISKGLSLYIGNFWAEK